MINVNIETFQRRVIRLLLSGPWKHAGIGLFGFASFALGATLATLPHGEVYLIGLWIVAVFILAFSWRE